MSSQWYYSKGGQRQGPVPSEKLKELAASGQIGPTDLVWKEGMAQWAEARTLKGLFPAPANKAHMPPPLPIAATSGPPPIPTTAPAAPSIPLTIEDVQSTAAAPALWNPKWLGAWSLPFSHAFGAFLLAQNWKALGEPAKAKRAMVWFYIAFPWFIVMVVASRFPLLYKCLQYSWLVLLAAFATLEVSPHFKFVKERFGDQFPRKSWWKPAGVALGAWTGALILAITALLLSGAGNETTQSLASNKVAVENSVTLKSKADPKTQANRPKVAYTEKETIQAMAQGVVGYIVTGNREPPKNFDQAIAGSIEKWTNVTPAEFNQLMRSMADALGAGNYEETRHLLTIEPTSQEQREVNGQAALFVTYGDGAVMVSFLHVPALGRLGLMMVSAGDKQYNLLSVANGKL